MTLELVYAGADFRPNRHCKTSPVDLDLQIVLLGEGGGRPQDTTCQGLCILGIWCGGLRLQTLQTPRTERHVWVEAGPQTFQLLLLRQFADHAVIQGAPGVEPPIVYRFLNWPFSLDFSVRALSRPGWARGGSQPPRRGSRRAHDRPRENNTQKSQRFTKSGRPLSLEPKPLRSLLTVLVLVT